MPKRCQRVGSQKWLHDMSSATTKTPPRAKRKLAPKRKKSAKKSARKKPRPKAKARVVLSPSAFGRELGVSRTAVTAAIEAGRLSKSVSFEERGSRSYARIDVELGREEWAKSTGVRKDTGEATIRPEDLGAGPSAPEGGESKDGAKPEINFAEERARKEMHLADRYELENAVRRSLLMDKEEVLLQLFGLGRVVRDGLQMLPAVLAPDLVGLSAKDIAIVLERELNLVAGKMAERAAQVAVEAGDGAVA